MNRYTQRLLQVLFGIVLLLGTVADSFGIDDANTVVLNNHLVNLDCPLCTEIKPGFPAKYFLRSALEASFVGYSTTVVVEFPDSVVPRAATYPTYAQVVGNTVRIQLDRHGGIGIGLEFDVKPEAQLQAGVVQIIMKTHISVVSPTGTFENSVVDTLALKREPKPEPPSFTVTLAAFKPTGEAINAQLLVEQDYTLKLMLSNQTESKLDKFRFTGGKPLVIDKRSTGGVAITDAPQIDLNNLSLDPGESIEYVYSVTTTGEGIAAAHSKVTARDEHGDDVEDSHSLLFRIANAQQLTQALGEFVVLRAMDSYLFKHYRDFFAGMQKRAAKFRAALTKRLDAQERLEWFGSTAEIEISNTDRAIGLLRGLPPEFIASSRPKAGFKGHTSEELDQVYDETFKDEVGKGVQKWVEGYTQLAADAQTEAKNAYAAAVMNVGWLNSTATAEERLQVEAFWSTFYKGSEQDAKNVVTTLRKEIPRWDENAKYALEALKEAERNGGLNGFKKGLNYWGKIIDKENKFRASLLQMADDDPVGFQREWAKQDAKILNTGLPVIFDTLLGAGVTKVVSAGGQLVKGKGAAMIVAGEEAGFLDDLGREIPGPNTRIALSESGLPSGLPLQTAAELNKAESLLKNTKGATLVQSSDHGNVYSMPNLGGVPETTLDVKAGILGELEQAYQKAQGKAIKLVEVLKTSSPLRKPGGVAKLELTAAKTGKAGMIDAGMPPDALGEAVYWRSATEPKDLPGFDKLSKARQDAAVAEWNAANTRYAKYENPPVGSKEAKLKSLIGQRGRVALDDAPNQAGLQRFVVGEFEEVVITQGDATAKLIRVKHYEIEVVDTTRSNLVVNRKTVIDNLPVAAAQTADADAVAVGKVVGTNSATGAPIVAPLDRAEREFVMSRYMDKNIKARRAAVAGLGDDLAEHGVTLVMEDASAKAAGFLLPSYGAPFLPESIGRAYLARIAEFVAPTGTTPEQMLETMLNLVQHEGGFGQHAVVVTSDSRYLGAVPFSKW